jgi:hypothetical protein
MRARMRGRCWKTSKINLILEGDADTRYRALPPLNMKLIRDEKKCRDAYYCFTKDTRNLSIFRPELALSNKV